MITTHLVNKQNIHGEWKGHEVEIDYDYYPESGDGWNEPREKEYAEINFIMIGRHDVSRFFTDEEIGAIAYEICAGVPNRVEYE